MQARRGGPRLNASKDRSVQLFAHKGDRQRPISKRNDSGEMKWFVRALIGRHEDCLKKEVGNDEECQGARDPGP